jgi:hypothetical protein
MKRIILRFVVFLAVHVFSVGLIFRCLFASIPSSFWPWPWNQILSTPPLIRKREVLLPDSVRARHSALFGSPGMGKSKLLQVTLIIDVIRRMFGLSSRGWCFFDPHGDTSDELISLLSLLALKFPQLYDRVVVIDLAIRDWVVVYNPLEARSSEDPRLKAHKLADIITTIYKDDPQVVVRLYRVAYYSFLTLSLARRTLLDLPELLTNRAFREEIVLSLPDPDVRRFWLSEFPKKDGSEASARVESTLNRLDRILQSPVADMFDGHSRINCRELMDRGCFVIVRAPRGLIGDDAAYLSIAFLIAEFEQAALSRADLPEAGRRPFTLYCDEFIQYLTPSIPRIINQARKYRLEIFLSTQEVKGHLRTDELMSACVGSVGSIFAMRLGYSDAEALVRELFMPPFDQVKHRQQLPNWQEQITWRSMDEIWQREIRKITTLPARQLWWREKGNLTTRKITTPTIVDVERLPDAHLIPEARSRLLEAVRMRYGRAHRRRILSQPRIIDIDAGDHGDPVEYE